MNALYRESAPPTRSSRRRRTLRSAALLVCVAVGYGLSSLLALPAANASGYPDKPIRFIVGFPPGGGSDLLARVVGQGLSEELGVPVVIDNKA